ncbi:hypothetical protein [Methylomonas sp. UP202]|uniref:hypothetical protein n=1 Tax=Methylomonas sp. UP202 TaxID=3040943 RepID=UPI00247A608B|nr:hypothetical protein [Methylomonas sp. UP202]WGS85424.1 hypothetical protein QC632_20675 [Methylomonas sp. UP202]
MNIATIGQTLAAYTAQAGNSRPANVTSREAGATPVAANATRTVDLRNVSLNEINSLIKAGVDGLLDIAPMMHGNLFANADPQARADVKIDYLGQIEGAIAFDKSRGTNTDFLESVLTKLKRIDGMPLPGGLDERV